MFSILMRISWVRFSAYPTFLRHGIVLCRKISFRFWSSSPQVRPNSIIGYSFSASNSCANSAIPLVNRLHPTLSEYIRFFSGMAHLHRHLCLLWRCPTLRRNLASFTLPALPAPVLWNRTYAVSPLSVSGEGRCYRAVVTYSGETACWVINIW